MDSRTWNLIAAVLLLLGFAVQWGIFSNRMQTQEDTAKEMKSAIRDNDRSLDSIKDDTAEIKTLIKSQLSAHEGL